MRLRSKLNNIIGKATILAILLIAMSGVQTVFAHFPTSIHTGRMTLPDLRNNRELIGQRRSRASWESRGIGGGGALFSATMSPHDAEVIYIATDMSAVFKTEDFGSTWTTIDFRELQGGIDSHIRFTSDPQVLYALHLANDIRTPVKSTDGGQVWTPFAYDPTGGEAYFLYADPNTTNRVLVSDWDNIYLSNDGGASFDQVYTAADPGAGAYIGGVFWDGEDIYIGTNDGVLVSDDGGQYFYSCFTFSFGEGIPDDEAIASFAGAKQSGTVRFFAVTMGKGDVWVGMTGAEYWGYKGIYTVDWGYGEWMPATSGIPGDVRPFFVGMALDDIDVAYVAGGNTATYAPIVYKTSNGGTTWENVFVTLHNQNIYTGWTGDGGDTQWWYGEYALGFAVSPIDPDRAIITDLGFAHVTDNGGASWRQAYVDSSDHNPAGSDTPTGRYYHGNGLEDTSCWWVHWVGQDTMIVGFSDMRGIRSTDGGQSWAAGSSLGLPQNSTYHIVEHPVDGTLYAATSSVHDLYQSTRLADNTIDNGDGYVVVSTGAGAAWQILHDFGHPVIWLAMDPNDVETMYASVLHSSDGGIYVTHDLSNGASATWVRLAEPPRTEGHPFNIHVLNDGTLVASYSGRRTGSGFTQSSGVFVSTDSGATWLDRSDPYMYRWTKDIVIDPHDGSQNTWYVSVFSHWGSSPNEVGGLYRTTDRGVSWSRLTDLYRVESATVHPDSSNVLYLSTETEGLWRTENLSNVNPTFTQVLGYPFRNPIRIFFNPSDHDEVWVTSFGSGLRVRLAMPSGIAELSPVPFQFALNASPNPFSSSCRFSMAFEDAWLDELQVFDLRGNVIWTHRDRETALSSPEQGGAITWRPGESVGSGAYVVQGTFSGERASRRVIYVR